MTTDSSNALADRYRKWDNLTPSLLEKTAEEEKLEKEESSEALGHTRVPYSEAEAKERAKAEMARKAKEALDRHKERESNAIAMLDDLLKDDRKEVVVNEEMIGERRVLSLRNCRGPGAIILPEVLSTLPSANARAGEDEKTLAVEGIIKVFVEDCHDCTIKFDGLRLITSMIEVSNCSNITLEMHKEQLSTVQADLCDGMTLNFMDAYCFGRKEDKIYHAGVKNMKVTIFKNSGKGIIMEKTMDYLRDGAVAQLSATPEEFQFVTSVVNGVLLTERLLRFKNKAVTERELLEERVKRGDSALSSDPSELTPEEAADVINQCLNHKEEGNEAFKDGQYAQAVLYYTMAIDKSSGLEKNCTYDNFKEKHVCYANRSACFLKLGYHDKALADADECLKIEPSYLKGNFRKGLSLHAMGRYEEALPVLAECIKVEPKNKQIKQAIQFCEVKLEMERRKSYQG